MDEEDEEEKAQDINQFDLQDMDTQDWIAKNKNKEIDEAVTSMKKLAELFKELSVMVIEQGTIVDRIDYNVEQTLTTTKKGRVHLEGAKKSSESARAKSCICCLISFIAFFAVLYILKHT